MPYATPDSADLLTINVRRPDANQGQTPTFRAYLRADTVDELISVITSAFAVCVDTLRRMGMDEATIDDMLNGSRQRQRLQVDEINPELWEPEDFISRVRSPEEGD